MYSCIALVTGHDLLDAQEMQTPVLVPHIITGRLSKACATKQYCLLDSDICQELQQLERI
jgi:hypothetical protein